MKRTRIAFRDIWLGGPRQYGSLRAWAKALASGIREVPYEIRYFLERGWYGITWRDCWNLDIHLAETLPWAIRMLNSENNPKASSGAPSSLAGEMGYYSLVAAETAGVWDVVDDEWKRRLEKMARGFEAIAEQNECANYEEYKRLEQIIQDGLREFVKYHNALWD